jgi:hypothetical protein
MLVTPQPPRFSVEEGPGLRLTLPCKKDWFRILFFSVWMVFWYVGESNEIPKVIKGLRSGEAPIFDIVWLVMWTFFGLFFSSWVIWRLLGSEVLGVANGRFTLRKQIAWIGKSWEFDTSQIAALRFRPEHGAGKGYRESRIELDYGAKTYNFATGIQPAEASQFLGLVAKWAPTVRIEKAFEPDPPASVQSLGLS